MLYDSFYDEDGPGYFDYNPIHAIWYLLVQSGFPESRLNSESFLAASITVYNEGEGEFGGISGRLKDIIDVKEYVRQLLDHVKGLLLWGSDGKFHIVLIRDDYVVDNLPVVNENVMLEEPMIDRLSWPETYGEISIQYNKRVYPPANLKYYHEAVEVVRKGKPYIRTYGEIVEIVRAGRAFVAIYNEAVEVLQTNVYSCLDDVALLWTVATTTTTTTFTGSTTTSTVTTSTVTTSTTVPGGYDFLHDIGSDDEGLDSGTLQGSDHTDNGKYYTFNESPWTSRGGIYWSNVADETDIDVLVRFRIREMDDASTKGSCIWKSGGISNGIAIGWNPDGEFGVFGRSTGSLTSMTFPIHELEENVWYDAYFTASKIVVEETYGSEGVEKTGTVTAGNGTDTESVGYSDTGGVIGGAAITGDYSKVDVDMVAVYTAGNLTIPSGHSAPSSKLLQENNFGTSGDESNGYCWRTTVNSPTANSTNVDFNGTTQGLNRLWSRADDDTCEFTVIFKVDSYSGDNGTIYKTGGYSNGVALGVNTSGDLGIFGRSSGSLTSIVIPSSKWSTGVWYEMYATGSRVTIVNQSTGAKVQQTGTLTRGNGTDFESFGYGITSEVISGINTTGDYFDGQIQRVRIYESGGVIHPSTTTTTTT